MSSLQWLSLLAFLGPMPALRPDPPRRQPDPGRVAGFLMLATVFAMVAPMIAIWGFHRPDRTFQARCEATGGRVVHAALSGDGPALCRKP